MITERDKIMLDWLQQFRIATADQLNRVAYNNLKVCYKRLQKLHSDGIIYRERNVVGMGYVFSTNSIRSVRQFQHDSIRNEFYLHLRDIAEITNTFVERAYGSIRPDATITCKYNDEFYFFLLEVETTANKTRVNFQKYDNFFLHEWKQYFKTKPTVIYATDKNLGSKNSSFDYIQISSDMQNLTDIFSVQ